MSDFELRDGVDHGDETRGERAGTAPSAQQRLAALAGEAALHRAFRWVHLHELAIRQWQLEFLAIAAPPFGERARALWFRDRFEELGLRDACLDAEGNAVALLPAEPGASPNRAVLLSAHLDTVFPETTEVRPVERDGRLYGPGACDNGAGLAGLLALAAALGHASLRPSCPVVFAANVGEEGAGDLRGMRHLFQTPPFGLRFAAAIALEGAGAGLVVDRALGSRRLRATVRGPGGHSWVNADQPNPILALGAALGALARLPLPSAPRTTLNVGRFSGGTSVNSIPETAWAELDLRSASELELDRLELTVLHRLSAEIGSETRHRPPREQLQLEVERMGVRPAGVLRPEEPLMQSLLAVDRHLRIATEPRIGSTDANLPLSLGIPALAVGAGGTGGGLHTLGEWFDPAGREMALRRVLLLLLDTCQSYGRVAASPATVA